MRGGRAVDREGETVIFFNQCKNEMNEFKKKGTTDII